MDKQKILEQKQKIIELLRDFCAEKLNEEYFSLAERLIQKLGRKRQVPFVSGKPESWAASTIHALGTINFLFDKSEKPYISIDDLNNFFGTGKSTTTNRSKEIRDMLKLKRWDNEFSTKKMQESNPYANLVMVDGFIVTIDSLPEEYQKLVRQARAEGKDISFRTQ